MTCLTNFKKDLLIFSALLITVLNSITTISMAQTETVLANGINCYLPEGKYYFNSDIPTPSSVLGFNVGDQYADWNDILKYMKALDQVSDRVSIREYGETYQHRRFIQVVITSVENQRNLETLQKEHLQSIQKAWEGNSKGESGDLSKTPVFVNLMNSIHGNEASGANASLILAYFFTAVENPDILKLLDNTIIIITPGLNPDGINRFASWVNSSRSFCDIADLNSREFSEPWPSSRTNHYWADCNRDWLSVQHPEGLNAVKMYRAWLPNVVVDQHEQGGDGKGFYFSPGHPLRTHPDISDENQKLTSEITSYIASGFDKAGVLYYSKDGYDDFFVGKGATYGDINGSIAILVEQLASRGFMRPTSMGNLSFPATVKNQVFAGYYSIIAAYSLKDKLIEYQRSFFANLSRSASKDKTQGYIFTTDGLKGIAHYFLTNMQSHNIEVYRLKKDCTADGRTFKANDSYVIPVNQINYNIIKTMWEEMKNYRDSTFYDISTWTFPYAYNLRYCTVENISGLIGNKVDSVQIITGKIKGGKSSYAYIFDNSEYFTPKLIFELLNRDLYLRISDRQFTSMDAGFKPGSIVIPVAGQPLDGEELYSLLERLSLENGVDIISMKSGLMKDYDLGSPVFKVLRKPEIAMIVGKGMGIPESGEIWHMLDQRFKIPVTLIDHTLLPNTDLRKYNVIIFADGMLSNSSIGSFAENLKRWIRDGGVLIATGNSYTITNEAKLTGIKTLPAVKKDSFDGVILKCIFNKHNPLGWGCDNTYIPIMRTVPVVINKAELKSSNVDIFMTYSDAPYLSGCISQNNLERISGTPAIITETVGKGKIIYIADDLNFRSYWLGGSKIFMNAIFFGYL